MLKFCIDIAIHNSKFSAQVKKVFISKTLFFNPCIYNINVLEFPFTNLIQFVGIIWQYWDKRLYSVSVLSNYSETQEKGFSKDHSLK